METNHDDLLREVALNAGKTLTLLVPHIPFMEDEETGDFREMANRLLSGPVLSDKEARRYLRLGHAALGEMAFNGYPKDERFYKAAELACAVLLELKLACAEVAFGERGIDPEMLDESLQGSRRLLGEATALCAE